MDEEEQEDGDEELTHLSLDFIEPLRRGLSLTTLKSTGAFNATSGAHLGVESHAPYIAVAWCDSRILSVASLGCASVRRRRVRSEVSEFKRDARCSYDR